MILEAAMDKSTFGHMVVNIQEDNLGFYKELFSFLGWKILVDDATMLGIEDKNKVSLWFANPIKKLSNDYDGIGMNHLAISVPSQAAVEDTVTYLQEHNIKLLFDTPRHRPEFCGSEDMTYFQAMFESPDHILFEVVYTGLRSKN
jgi:catechol 2,3-dioxygenase-like lactoylglutathione lyase family enzyme